MTESHVHDAGQNPRSSRVSSAGRGVALVVEPAVSNCYEQLLNKLADAEYDLAAGQRAASRGHLEEASAIVFDLLYSLDFKGGGELVSRLAALYGFIANELLSVSRTGDPGPLIQLRSMVASLKQTMEP